MPSRRGNVPAADEYQAPSFGRPIYAPKKGREEDDADASPVSHSPFFSDKENVEALEWAQRHAERSEEEGEGEQAGNVSPSAVEDDYSQDEQEARPIRHRRRDSQLSSYDEVGSVFDGPSAGAVPSSMTR